MDCHFILQCCVISKGMEWICDCLNVLMDYMSCLGEEEVMYEDEVEKSS